MAFSTVDTPIIKVSLDVTFTSGWRRLNQTLGVHGAQFSYDFFLDTSVHVSRFTSDYQYTALGSLYQTGAWFFFLMY